MNKEDYLLDYIANQVGYNHLLRSINRHKYNARDIQASIQNQIEDFIEGKSEQRWLVLPGLRGVGKTTLLAQIYNWAWQKWVFNRPDSDKINMLYVSLDVVRNMGGDLATLLRKYELVLKRRLENSDRSILLFLDEVQIDPLWARTLKTVYDQADRVFIICTGSAATYLQMDADTAGRRAQIKRLYPLGFTESQLLAHNKPTDENLKRRIFEACYYSSSADEAFRSLQKLEAEVALAWAKYDYNQVENYLEVETMPFTFNKNRVDVYQATIDNTNKIIVDDLVADRGFNFGRDSSETIKELLVMLANSSGDNPSLTSLGRRLDIAPGNVLKMLKALVKAEVLIRIPAYGKILTSTRQPVRYQFMSPLLRNAYWEITGRKQTANTRRGQLLEDAAGLHYYSEFIGSSRGFLTYPYSKKDPGWSNFILKVADSRQVALEFGLGQKKTKHVEDTLNKFNCDYGLVFSESPLKIHGHKNIVLIPLQYFFLM